MLIRTTNNAYSALPDTTSMGTQEKWVIGNRFYKLDPIMGYDSLAEATVSELESYIENIEFVDYFIDLPKTINGRKRRVCYSENCVHEGYTEITLYKLLTSVVKDKSFFNKYKGKDLLLKIAEIVEKEIYFNPMEYFSKIIYLDSITLNEDRHFNNISFLVNDKGFGKGMPILDNGRALLSNEEIYSIDRSIQACVRSVKSKPFATSFKKQVGYFLDSYKPLIIDYNSAIKSLDNAFSQAEDFSFGNKLSARMLRRMISVLKTRMKEQEGITWIRK